MKYRNAFTKIDLAVILCCLVFLAMNLGVVTNAGRQRAKDAVCLSNLNQWGQLFQMYLGDHDGMFMTGPEKWFYGLGPYYGWKPETQDFNHIPSYRRQYMLRFCPTATKIKLVPTQLPQLLNEGGMAPYHAWTVGFGSSGEPWDLFYWDGSYGANSLIYSSTSYPASSRAMPGAWRNTNVKNTNQIPVLLDCGDTFGGRPTENDLPRTGLGDYIFESSGGFMKIFMIDRHNGFTHSLFMDWSVRPVGIKELYTLRWSRIYNTCGRYTLCGNGGNPVPWGPATDYLKKYQDF